MTLGSDPNIVGTVAEVMVTQPKTLPADASIADAQTAFEDDHVVMLLLTSGRALLGTLLREDLPADASPCGPALPLAHVDGRTVAPTEDADAAQRRLLENGTRRLAVISNDGELLGLMCLKRRRNGFCSDAGIAARARASRAETGVDRNVMRFVEDAVEPPSGGRPKGQLPAPSKLPTTEDAVAGRARASGGQPL